jgi:hypothetical protein
MEGLFLFYSNYVKLCSKINKSPSAVGEELGFTRASVTGWGNGATPRKSSLIKIADYFGVTVTELMSGVGEQEKAPATKGEGLSATVQELFDFIDTATGAELNELLRYAQFLMSKR